MFGPPRRGLEAAVAEAMPEIAGVQVVGAWQVNASVARQGAGQRIVEDLSRHRVPQWKERRSEGVFQLTCSKPGTSAGAASDKELMR